MRIVGGRARGTKINTIESMTTRPTLDRVRESLFNIIQNDIKDAIVLDLFAGSGALGIEALSRGASKAYFCDSNIKAVRVIKDNITKTRFENEAEVYNCDYKKCLEQIKERVDIIFIDPPYKEGIAVEAVSLIENNNRLKNSLMIIETDEPERDEQEIKNKTQMKIIDRRKYGRAFLLFLRKCD